VVVRGSGTAICTGKYANPAKGQGQTVAPLNDLKTELVVSQV